MVDVRKFAFTNLLVFIKNGFRRKPLINSFVKKLLGIDVVEELRTFERVGVDIAEIDVIQVQVIRLVRICSLDVTWLQTVFSRFLL